MITREVLYLMGFKDEHVGFDWAVIECPYPPPRGRLYRRKMEELEKMDIGDLVRDLMLHACEEGRIDVKTRLNDLIRP